LAPAQKTLFERLVLVYNLVAYPVCLLLLYYVVARVVRAWHRLVREPLPEAEIARARSWALALPLWAVGLSCAGWLPGAVLFPVRVPLWAEPVTAEVFGHFLVSFTISGLIALTYSYFAAQYLAVRVLYPRLWGDAQEVRSRARAELGSVGR